MTIHAQALTRLAPEDYMLIEGEHLRLKGTINNLRRTCINLDTLRSCQSCSREKLATCQGRLASFFYNILDMSSNHFSHEEAIMRRRSPVTQEQDDFRDHQQAHRNILYELDALVRACTLLDEKGNTADGYRQLHTNTSNLFEQHDRLFDASFIQATTPGNIPYYAAPIAIG